MSMLRNAIDDLWYRCKRLFRSEPRLTPIQRRALWEAHIAEHRACLAEHEGSAHEEHLEAHAQLWDAW